MIIALVVLLGLIGFAMVILDKYEGAVNFIGIVLSVVCLLICVVMIIAHGTIFLSADGTAAALQARYDTLMYQVEHHLYEDEVMSVSMRDFMKEITEWNTELATNQALQDNIWVGIFYPNIYNNFNFITL